MISENTKKVIRWALSRPVLAHRLRMIAADGLDDQELACTVVDLLDPNRKKLWADYLHATGAPASEADALWKELGGIAGIYPVDWDRVRQALLSIDTPSGA